MATSSINDKFVIRSKKALKQFDKAFQNKAKLSEIKPLTDEELKKGKETVIKWLSSQSTN